MTELAITMAIIGLLATIAYPSFRALIPRYKFESDSNLLANQLNLVRLQAISRNREFKVFLSASDDRFTVSEGNKSRESDAWTPRETRVLNHADIYNVESIPGNALRFTPEGTVDETGEALPDGIGRVYTRARDGSMSRRIVVSAITGRLTVERGVAGAWQDERYLKE